MAARKAVRRPLAAGSKLAAGSEPIAYNELRIVASDVVFPLGTIALNPCIVLVREHRIGACDSTSRIARIPCNPPHRVRNDMNTEGKNFPATFANRSARLLRNTCVVLEEARCARSMQNE
jgi:hypothetical protein